MLLAGCVYWDFVSGSIVYHGSFVRIACTLEYCRFACIGSPYDENTEFTTLFLDPPGPLTVSIGRCCCVEC